MHIYGLASEFEALFTMLWQEIGAHASYWNTKLPITHEQMYQFIPCKYRYIFVNCKVQICLGFQVPNEFPYFRLSDYEHTVTIAI